MTTHSPTAATSDPTPLTASPRRPSEVRDLTSAPGVVAAEPSSFVPLSPDEVRDVVGAAGTRPRRADGDDARRALATDGAVVVPARAVTPGTTAVVAAELVGERLRQLFPLRHRGIDSDGLLALHADSFQVVHDVHGALRPDRDPDEDLLLMQLARAPREGGDSVVVDAYAVVDRLADLRPALHEVLTSVDLDLQGAWRDLPGVPASTRVGGVVEYTRRGRRLVRLGDGIRPLLRSPQHAEHAAALAALRAVAVQVAAAAPRTTLAVGDVLVLDNYRCWHGRDPFTGPRQLFVQTARTDDAY